ncbi:DUF3078 domain-containing protein [Abyssalbus ytuae]|uniref:DUF3078 domain-containing protein n=1 Tax=Abyssalbus ytuae TaxID=2926907 RepID=A0A9E6ZSR1_9FLAO|nr:DUF3078 domain-containing protein [Abyssalbus ytuae]UOB15991.1 DUF3078 domain-containing protein [Abyssalbus ytuae]
MKHKVFYLFLFFLNLAISQKNESEIVNRISSPKIPLIVKKDTLDLAKVLDTVIPDKPVAPRWKKTNKTGLNINEVAFVNWNAGGNNSVTAIANANFRRQYKFKDILWNSEMLLSYGLNSQEGQKIRKTQDNIQVTSSFGYKTKELSSWYFSGKTSFQTQFSNGYNYPNRDVPISRFMAPGYLFLGIGSEYSPSEKDFNLYISPVTLKSTFVLDQNLADQGSFGVEAAEYDNDGNRIKKGKNVRSELGFLVTSLWLSEIYKNMFFSNRVSLYSDYLNSFGNVDVDWEMNLELKFNQYIAANVGAHLRYDNDVKFKELVIEENETVAYSPRLQFKQLFGIGLVYNF